MTPRARVIRAADVKSRAEPLLKPAPGQGQRRRIAREEIEARLGAERILDDARSRADAILAEARALAEDLKTGAAREAQQEARAELATRWVALRHAEHGQIERDADRMIPVAVALAERLLGAALELDGARVAQLARAVLDEARGARRAVIDAHPQDAEALRRHLTNAGLDVQSIEVKDDTALARGDLRLHTDVGTIDARLAPRFERLAAALRDTLV